MSNPVKTTVMGSAALKFRVNYEEAKLLPTGKAVRSDVVSAGGHLWRIDCYPRGPNDDNKGEYLSLYLKHMSTSTSTKATFDAYMIDRQGQASQRSPSVVHEHEFQINGENGDDWGWGKFVKRSNLEKKHVTDGLITFVCSISIAVTQGSSIPVPPSEIGVHLGHLLDRKDGTDVSFTVGGETFHAHRAVLAARSPVFRAELFGSMAEATMSSITLHDITPPTFKAMLRFMYTDNLPADDELGDALVEMFQDLLAAADRYALDRLKLMCAQKLWDNVSVDTVATILTSAERYGCLELKNNCYNFFAVYNNFKRVAFTHEFAVLVLKFPSIAAELSKRVMP